MKKKIIALPLMAALLLTACNQERPNENVQTQENTSAVIITTDGDNDETEGETGEVTEIVTTTTEKQEPPVPDTAIKGVCGEDINVSDFLNLHPDIMIPDWLEAAYTFYGFGYYSPSDGTAQVVSSGSNPPDCPAPVYQHINVGDEIGGLQLKEASGMLFVDSGELQLVQQELIFSGTIKLKGYIYLCVGDELYCEEDEILFFPSEGEWKDLPFQGKHYNSDILGEDYSSSWYGSAPILHIGKPYNSIYDDVVNASKNVSEVTVTIRNPEIRDCFTDMFFGGGAYRNVAEYDEIIF